MLLINESIADNETKIDLSIVTALAHQHINILAH